MAPYNFFERDRTRPPRRAGDGARMAVVAARHRDLLAVLRRRDPVDATAVRVHIVDELWRPPPE